MSKAKDISGKKYGRLTVIEWTGETSNRGRVWLCRCECGNTIEKSIGALNYGETKSCGCLRKEVCANLNKKHGLKKHPLYNTWKNIKQRCSNENRSDYYLYGGRGIEVCDKWKNSFMEFIKDTEEKYFICLWKNGESYIDRIDNNGNYEPSNVRFITNIENCNNQRRNRIIEYNDESKSLSQWARYFNISKSTFKYRIDNWTKEKAFKESM